MLSKVQKPKTKQELIKALQTAPIKSIQIYEGADLDKLPSKAALAHQVASVIIVAG